MENRYDGRCRACDCYVAARSGIAVKVGSRWAVLCAEHKDAEVAAPAPSYDPKSRVLTDAEFWAANDRLSELLLGSKRGTPERAAAEAVQREWDAAYRLPAVKWEERQIRLRAIAVTAVRHGLVKS